MTMSRPSSPVASRCVHALTITCILQAHSIYGPPPPPLYFCVLMIIPSQVETSIKSSEESCSLLQTLFLFVLSICRSGWCTQARMSDVLSHCCCLSFQTQFPTDGDLTITLPCMTQVSVCCSSEESSPCDPNISPYQQPTHLETRWKEATKLILPHN